MERKEMAKKINSLIQLDIDAVHAYRQAVEHIDDVLIKQRLTDFLADHQRHITELSETVQLLGEKAPEFSRDFKGFILEGFTALRSVTGTKGALKAMEANEKTTNRKYQDATEWDLSLEAQMLVQKNYADEKRHLTYIQEVLASKTWEK